MTTSVTVWDTLAQEEDGLYIGPGLTSRQNETKPKVDGCCVMQALTRFIRQTFLRANLFTLYVFCHLIMLTTPNH